ncbi:MAG: hypothetical protein DHS20C17_30170 [Cyclobacteriaceae bacterium]|nr:MAG: hypothetical protein DHS20C17_30170 [Cyclobacteriaceae bacterium]
MKWKFVTSNYRILYWLTFICLYSSCNSDDGGGVGGISTGDLILEAITGEWAATSATFTTVNVNPVRSRDLITDGGLCDLSISQNRRFSLVVRNPGVAGPQLTTGLFEPNGNFIDVRLDTDPNVLVRWNFTLSGDNLSIDGPLDYDFEDDGTFEQTSMALQLIPN